MAKAGCPINNSFQKIKMSSKKKGGRSRKLKASDEHLSDDDEAFIQTFDVAEKLKSKDFPRFFIREITGPEVGLSKFHT